MNLGSPEKQNICFRYTCRHMIEKEILNLSSRSSHDCGAGNIFAGQASRLKTQARFQCCDIETELPPLCKPQSLLLRLQLIG